jgi:hypothetical protein
MPAGPEPNLRYFFGSGDACCGTDIVGGSGLDSSNYACETTSPVVFLLRTGARPKNGAPGRITRNLALA